MIVTSIEQSKKLIELGLDRKMSDMCYPKEAFSTCYDEPRCCRSLVGLALSAWSLDALLKLMPKAIGEGATVYTFSLLPTWDKTWYAVYETADYNVAHSVEEKEPLNAVYKMLLYVIKNGYLKEDK